MALRAEQTWQLNLPNRQQFDASALLLQSNGHLLTLNDRSFVVYRIDFLQGTNAAALLPVTELFSPDRMKPFGQESGGRFDCEGLAMDTQGRIYLCEEGHRWIFRCDPKTRQVERLAIDWSPVKSFFHEIDINASFEGIAIGDDRLYVANERQTGQIIVVDLGTLKVTDHFSVRPASSQARDVHFTDLCWFEGALFVLLRESRYVLQVDPGTRRVQAEFYFGEMERQRDVAYSSLYPTGSMEGLAVEKNFFWLVTDNNGRPRARYPQDMRPTLFKCPRPDQQKTH
jgi:uncharacterized protein YjiK